MTKFHQNRSTLKGRSAGQRQTDTQTDKPVGFTARLRPQVRMPQFGMPAERRAQLRVPNMPRSRISKRSPFRIYEHTQCWVFERTCLQRPYVIPWRKWGRPLCYGHAAPRWWLQWARGACGGRKDSTGRGCHVHTCIMAIGADFKMYLLHHFCLNRVEFFYNKQETQTQKMIDQNFDIRILWFLRIFLNILKGVARSLCGRCGPLWSRPN